MRTHLSSVASTMTAFDHHFYNDSHDEATSDHQIVDRIAAQIARGVDVTTTDVEALSKVAFGQSSSLPPSMHHMESFSAAKKASFPLLDREYLLEDHIERPGHVKLVRYVGMVQDMLETEYYVSTDRWGKPTHYRDVVEGGMGEDHEECMMGVSLGERLAERTPLVVVPIPFGSNWVIDKLKKQKRGEDDSADSDIMIENEAPEEDWRSSKKRSRDTEVSEPLLSKRRIETNGINSTVGSTLAAPREMGWDSAPSNTNCGSAVEQEQFSSSDWWPSGCMGSDVEQCPVLAKVYYDRLSNKESGPTTRKLRLNDLVEFIGVVSVNPLEAEFSNQQSSSSAQPMPQPVMDSGFSFFEEDVLGGECPLAIPPPSQLPRFHVLCYNLLDLDQLGKSLIRKSRDDHEEMEEEQPSLILSEPMDYRKQAIHLLASEPVLCNNTVVSEATLLTLLSMAQRKLTPTMEEHSLPSWDPVASPTESMTIGCASLDIQLPSQAASRHFYVRFHSLLQDLCPVVAAFDVTRESLNNGRLLQAPSKDSQGRLVPSLLQLPKGSTVLLHMGNMSEGVLSPQGQETLTALQSLVQNHVIHYTFGAKAFALPFEADLRVIVVSVAHSRGGSEKENMNRCSASTMAARSKLLKCALRVQLNTEETASFGATDDNMEDDGCYASRRKRIREFVAARRYVVEDDTCATLPAGSNNISLSHNVIKVAQEEFIQRRNVARQMGNKVVGEDDFHRWLTLTRLQTRSRNNNLGSNGAANSRQAAIMEDWERALALDDFMTAGC